MYVKTIKLYLEIMKGSRALWLLGFLGSMLFFIGVDVIGPYILSRFINGLSTIDTFGYQGFRNFIILWVGLHIAQTSIGRVGMISWIKASTRIRQKLDGQVFTKIMNQSTHFFNENFVGSLVSKFNRFDRSFDTIQTSVMMDFSSLTVQIIFPFIILFSFVPVIAIIMLVWVVIFSVVMVFMYRFKTHRAQAVAAQDSKITGLFTDLATNALSVKLFSKQKLELKSFERQNEIRKNLRRANWYRNDVIRVVKVVFITALEVPVFYFIFKSAEAKEIDVGQIILIQLYIGQLISSLWNIGKIVEKLDESFADAAEMTELYMQIPSILDPTKPEKNRMQDGRVHFYNINFSYHEDSTDKDILFQDFSLTIPAGQKVGLVGPSGGGKTTLTKLILRLMDINDGVISIDGQDITKITQDDLRRSISYVPQEPLLFHRSIYENIAYGDPSASRKEVLHAAKLAHVDEFADKMPEGYD